MTEKSTVTPPTPKPLDETPKIPEAGLKSVILVRDAKGVWSGTFNHAKGDFLTHKDFDNLIRLLQHQKLQTQREVNLYNRLKASQA